MLQTRVPLLLNARTRLFPRSATQWTNKAPCRNLRKFNFSSEKKIIMIVVVVVALLFSYYYIVIITGRGHTFVKERGVFAQLCLDAIKCCTNGRGSFDIFVCELSECDRFQSRVQLAWIVVPLKSSAVSLCVIVKVYVVVR